MRLRGQRSTLLLACLAAFALGAWAYQGGYGGGTQNNQNSSQSGQSAQSGQSGQSSSSSASQANSSPSGQASSSSTPSGQANESPSEEASEKGMASKGMSADQRDANFINTVNNGEVQESQNITDKLKNSDVKDYAKMVADDHKDAQDKLQKLASQKGWTLATDEKLQREEQRDQKRLSSAPEARVDRTYLRDEVRDHQQAIRRLKRMQNTTQDQDLKNYIAQTLPVMQKHLDRARQLQQSVSGAAAGQPAGAASQSGTPESQEEQREHHGNMGNMGNQPSGGQPSGGQPQSSGTPPM